MATHPLLSSPEAKAAAEFAAPRTAAIVPFSGPITPPVDSAAAGFLRAVLPAQGLKVIAEFGPKGVRHHFFETHEQAAAKALALDAAGANVYFGCATYKTSKSREAENAGWMQSFWVDADVDPTNPAKYESQKAAVQDIARVRKELQLPLPLVVRSGGGVHAYWVLDAAIALAEWKPAAERLKRVLKQLDFRQDPSRTADAASILRPVGTHWRKAGERLVEAINQAKPITFASFEAALQNYEQAHVLAPLGKRSDVVPGLPVEDDLSAGMQADPYQPYPFEVNAGDFRVALHTAFPRPERRDDQWRVGEMALAFLVQAHDWPESEAKALLDEWSGLAPNADASNNDRDWRDTLERTKRRTDVKDRSVTTHRSILKLARQAGWSPSITTIPAAASETPGDILNARLFAGMYRNRLLYVFASQTWLQWDGGRWLACNAGEEMQAAKAAAGAILEHCIRKAKELGDDAPRAKRLVANALRAQKENGLLSMVRLARSEPGMQVASIAELDPNPLHLGVQNGVLDLRSGALLAATPDMLITRQCGAEYHRDRTAPRWEAFQLEIAGGDKDMVRYKQRALGYCLTGLVQEEKLFFAFGYGANGKSVEANVLSAIFGDYVVTAPGTMFAAKRDGDGPRNDVARLAGARLVLANETQSGDRLDEQLVKTLVSRERITARFLHREFFEFDPTFKILIRGNHKPIITGDDLGIWRRIDLWPYEQTFQGDQADPELEAKLLAERDGILAWIIEGCLEWRRVGLVPPAAVRKASATYRAECDVLGDFLTAECSQSPELFIGQPALYASYKEWCLLNTNRPMSKAQFTRKLAERGIREGRRQVSGARTHTYEGICPDSRVPLLARVSRT